MPYRKTGTEWEILGELAQRLHHREEAKDAFQRALDQKFSAKAWLKLLEIYVDEGDVQRSLNAAIRLSVYQHRWYMEQSVRSQLRLVTFHDAAELMICRFWQYPTAVAKELFKLIRRDGLAKISYSLVSVRITVTPYGRVDILSDKRLCVADEHSATDPQDGHAAVLCVCPKLPRRVLLPLSSLCSLADLFDVTSSQWKAPTSDLA